MSHQTGIKSNAELREHFGKARDVASTVRLIKVQIDTTKEEMKFVDSRPIANDWRTDYRAYMGAVVEKEQPCYIFFRLDNLNNLGGHDWVLVLYLPITAAVRSKMLYASTKTTLKNDFGTRTRFDYLAEAFEDIAYETFAKWMVDKTSKDVEFTDEQERVLGNASAIKMSDLRTVVEEERHKIKALELAESAQKSNKNLSNFQFPIHQDAINGLLDFRDDRIPYLKLRVNISNEEIILVDRRDKSAHPKMAELYDVFGESGEGTGNQQQLLLKDPKSNLGTGFYLVSFYHLDATKAAVRKNIFIYVMNPTETSIKERISYSACLHSLYDSIANRISVPIDKRLEVDDIADVTVEYIAERLYPQLDKAQLPGAPEGGNGDFPARQELKFSKPKPPNSRRGLIK